MFELDDITNLINMSTTQPETPSDAFTIDWASEVNTTVPGFMDPTTPNQQSIMFPGLSAGDSSWTAEPPPFGLLYETSHYPDSASLPLPVIEPYPSSVLPPGLDFMFASATTPTASTPSTPSTASTFASPASGLDFMFASSTPTASTPSTPSTTSTFASPALSHISSYPYPYDPSSQPRTTSVYDYMSPYTSPSHAALVHNPPRRPAQYHPIPSSLGPNRTARARPLVLSQPYPQTPSALANARLRSSVCPLADPGYDWSALRSPTTLVSSLATSSGSTIAGWVEQAITAPVAHGPSAAPVESHLHELQTVMSSSNDSSSTASSPAPSLSFLHAEASPAVQSRSPSPWNPDIDATAVSSTVFSTTPTGPMFPGLTSTTSSVVPATLAVAPLPMSLPLASMISSPPAPVPSSMPIPRSTNMQTGLPITGPPTTPTPVPNPMQTSTYSMPRMTTSMQNAMPTSIPTSMPTYMPINISSPEPTPAPATPVRTPFPESLLAFAASKPVSSMPTSAPSLDSACCAPVALAPDETGVPTLDPALAATHSPAPALAHPRAQIPTSGGPRTPAHLSVHSLARPPTRNMIRSPTHARIDTPAPIDDALDTWDTTTNIFASTAGPTASSTPARMPLASSQHTRQASSNIVIPAFTWADVPTTHAIAQAAADDALNGDQDDDIDREIALAAGLQLSNTGFQSAERLTEGVSDGSDLSGRLSTQDNSKRGGKKAATLGTKWTGGPGGELTIHGLPQGIDGQVHRWTFSEQPLNSLDPQALDATGRTEGDVHFSSLPQSRRSDPPFVTWVAVKIRGTDLQWIQWQGGHPHPVNAGYVLKPAQLPRTKPQWVKKETWLKTVAKGKEVATDS
ncbi:hypothetical protein FRC09_000506, partial [Ceratobasidium sp. 395]